MVWPLLACGCLYAPAVMGARVAHRESPFGMLELGR